MSELERAWRLWLRGALSATSLRKLDDLAAFGAGPGFRLDVTAARESLLEVDRLVSDVLPGAHSVRVVAFNKSTAENWSLAWHQDRVVILPERVEMPGYTNWTRKAGVWHAEPPLAVLEHMVFVRCHLDAATPQNGCMQVALGSHLLGRVSAAEAADAAQALTVEDCVAARGDVLIAKALLLHRSGASQQPTPQRALRIDYQAGCLP